MNWTIRQWQRLSAFVTRNALGWVLVSLLGGVPGIITTCNAITSKPEFIFHPSGYSGHFVNGSNPQFNFFLIHGAVYNPGDQPLFPIGFFLDVELLNGQKLILAAQGFDDSLLVRLNRQNNRNGVPNLRVSEKASDLMISVRVNAKDAQFGILYFPFEGLYGDISIVKTMKLKCVDITEKQYSVAFDMDRFVRGRGADPKTGVRSQ